MSAIVKTVKPKGDTNFVYKISDQSKQEIIRSSKTAMVYGFQHCKYAQVHSALERDLARTYDCSLGNDLDTIPAVQRKYHKTVRGRDIHKIKSGLRELRTQGKSFETQDCNRKCKTGLVNLVLENYKAENDGGDFTPIVFCIDVENNPYPLTSENLLSKTKIVEQGFFRLEMNRIVTHTELRRAYKLCNDPEVDSEIRRVAQATFKFVKVTEVGRTERTIERPAKIDIEKTVTYKLEGVSAPWEKADFAPEFAKRKAYAATQPGPAPKAYNWRAQVNTQAKQLRIEAQRAAQALCASSVSPTDVNIIGDIVCLL